MLLAAANVQQDLKCPVSIHPGRDLCSPTEALRVFQEAGGDAARVAMCHLDSKEGLMKSQRFFQSSCVRDYVQTRGVI